MLGSLLGDVSFSVFVQKVMASFTILDIIHLVKCKLNKWVEDKEDEEPTKKWNIFYFS